MTEQTFPKACMYWGALSTSFKVAISNIGILCKKQKIETGAYLVKCCTFDLSGVTKMSLKWHLEQRSSEAYQLRLIGRRKMSRHHIGQWRYLRTVNWVVAAVDSGSLRATFLAHWEHMAGWKKDQIAWKDGVP